MGNEEAEYEVENITQARVEREKGRKKNLIWKYNVRWKGYGSDDDTWEPKESFVGSEHMIEQFWERANTSGRDYQDLSLFKIGEEFDLTGPPRRKRKRQPVKPALAIAPEFPQHPRTLETGSSASDERKHSPSVIEIQDSDDERRPKRVREDKEFGKSSPEGPISRGRDTNIRNTSQKEVPLPTKTRNSPRKFVRGPSYDEIIPASDDELARAHNTDSFKVATKTNFLEASWDDSQGHVDTIADGGQKSRESAIDDDNPPNWVASNPVVDTASPTTKLPAHRMKAANPRVKITEVDYPAPEGALSIKARLSGRAKVSSAKSSSYRHDNAGNGSKPGPGRSSAGFMKKNTSSLLTFEKGELKTVKGRYNKEAFETKKAVDSPPGSLWGGDDEIEDNDDPDFLNAAPPTANELLHLAGADSINEPLPDFEDELSAIVPITSDSPIADEQPTLSTEENSPSSLELQQETSRPAHWESLQRAKNNLFPSSTTSTSQAPMPLWKQSTMFGPLGFGLNSQPNEISVSDIAQSPPFFINVNNMVSIPVILTDVAPSNPGSLSLEFIVAKRGPPGVFYKQKAALALLNTLRTGGPSAKIGLHPSANSNHKSQFVQFCSRLSAGELYAGMAGNEFLAFCSSNDLTLSQRLNISPQLLGQPDDIFVERVTIENYSAYAEAALAGIEG